MSGFSLDNVNEMYLDVLKEIGNVGAGNATTAIAGLLGERMNMSVPNVGHGRFGSHIPALNDTQFQQLIAHLIDFQIGAVIKALGGHHHADAVFQAPVDAPEALVQHGHTAQTKGLMTMPL